MYKIESNLAEVLSITQEECAEVIQAISKIGRFGLNSEDGYGKSYDNMQNLEEEIGDLMGMLSLLMELKFVDTDRISQYADAKIQKLKKWSSIDFKKLKNNEFFVDNFDDEQYNIIINDLYSQVHTSIVDPTENLYEGF